MSTDIQRARDVLAKWRDGVYTSHDSVLHRERRLVATHHRFGAPTVGDTALIVGTAGNPELLDAIDGLLHHVWKYPAWSSGHMCTYAARIAAAIIAADERMSA